MHSVDRLSKAQNNPTGISTGASVKASLPTIQPYLHLPQRCTRTQSAAPAMSIIFVALPQTYMACIGLQAVDTTDVCLSILPCPNCRPWITHLSISTRNEHGPSSTQSSLLCPTNGPTNGPARHDLEWTPGLTPQSESSIL